MFLSKLVQAILIFKGDFSSHDCIFNGNGIYTQFMWLGLGNVDMSILSIHLDKLFI